MFTLATIIFYSRAAEQNRSDLFNRFHLFRKQEDVSWWFEESNKLLVIIDSMNVLWVIVFLLIHLKCLQLTHAGYDQIVFSYLIKMAVNRRTNKQSHLNSTNYQPNIEVLEINQMPYFVLPHGTDRFLHIPKNNQAIIWFQSHFTKQECLKIAFFFLLLVKKYDRIFLWYKVAEAVITYSNYCWWAYRLNHAGDIFKLAQKSIIVQFSWATGPKLCINVLGIGKHSSVHPKRLAEKQRESLELD